MKDPLKLLRAKRREISSEYKRILKLEYPTGGNTTEKNSSLFKSEKKETLKKIKAHLDKYDEAIRILVGVGNYEL